MPYPTCFIGGTWSLGDPQTLAAAVAAGHTDVDWFSPRSDFGLAARTHGVELVDPDEPFVWSTRVAGLMSPLDAYEGLPRWIDWYAAGWALANWWRVHGKTVNVIGHSHGGNCAIMAAALGLQIDTLITAGTPVREDLTAWRQHARRNIRYWLHLSSPNDMVQLQGEVGGGGWNQARDMPEADLNLLEPTEEPDAHRKLMDEALWTKRFYWNYLLTAVPGGTA